MPLRRAVYLLRVPPPLLVCRSPGRMYVLPDGGAVRLRDGSAEYPFSGCAGHGAGEGDSERNVIQGGADRLQRINHKI